MLVARVRQNFIREPSELEVGDEALVSEPFVVHRKEDIPGTDITMDYMRFLQKADPWMRHQYLNG